MNMKTLIALFLTCFTCALFGQAPPILRNSATTNNDAAIVRTLVTNNAVAVERGMGNSNFFKSPTMWSAVGVTTNWYHGVGTVSGVANTHTLTFSTPQTLKLGDDVAITVPPFAQFTITRSNSPTEYMVKHFPDVATVPSAATFDVYPTMFWMTEINGVPVMYIQADGGVGIMGNEPGQNSGSFDFIHSDGSNNWSMVLSAFNSSVYGANHEAIVLINNNKPGSSGNVALFSSEADEYAFAVMPNGYVMSRFGFTNSGTSILMGNVGIGTVSGTARLVITNPPGTTGIPLMRAGTNDQNGLTIAANGNVGIGTATPPHLFSQYTDTRYQTNFSLFYGTTNLFLMRVMNNGSGGQMPMFSLGLSTGGAQGVTLRNNFVAANDLYVDDGNANAFLYAVSTRFNPLTPVGIGGQYTMVPLAKLHATNGAASTLTARLDQSATNSILQGISGNTLQWSGETNGWASYSTQATNELVATGYTNTTGVNMQAMVNATAVSFTVNNRAGTVIYTSPVLTGVVPVGLQPGWSIRGASGLAGTVIPGL